MTELSNATANASADANAIPAAALPAGRLFGVSLGPGDPGLITRRAWELLQRPDAVWTYPVRSLRKESYALDIALRAGLTLPAQHEALLFPMTHDAEKLARHWLKAAQTVQALLATGQDVLFLVEGDASTYASFGYLARVLRELDEAAQIEIVAGVNSFNAACARLQIPLSEQDDTIAIVPAAYGIAASAAATATSGPMPAGQPMLSATMDRIACLSPYADRARWERTVAVRGIARSSSSGSAGAASL